MRSSPPRRSASSPPSTRSSITSERLITEAAAPEPDWPGEVIAALRAALDFFTAEPDLARLCLLESVSSTPRIAIRYRDAVLAGVPALARGRAELGDPDSLLPEAESSIIGGAVSLATRSIITGKIKQLPELLPDVVDFTLSPYLGAERALDLAAEIASKRISESGFGLGGRLRRRAVSGSPGGTIAGSTRAQIGG